MARIEVTVRVYDAKTEENAMLGRLNAASESISGAEKR
jgi:hypothetical protein